MARLRPQQPMKIRKESSFGKWIFLLILCGIGVGAYMKQDELKQKLHDFIHGAPPAEQAVAPPPPRSLPTGVIASPAPAPVPVSTAANPCGAYANDSAQMALCKDRMDKIQHMKDAAAARDKAFQAPVTNTTAQPGAAPATNTTTPSAPAGH